MMRCLVGHSQQRQTQCQDGSAEQSLASPLLEVPRDDSAPEVEKDKNVHAADDEDTGSSNRAFDDRHQPWPQRLVEPCPTTLTRSRGKITVATLHTFHEGGHGFVPRRRALMDFAAGRPQPAPFRERVKLVAFRTLLFGEEAWFPAADLPERVRRELQAARSRRRGGGRLRDFFAAVFAATGTLPEWSLRAPM